MNGNELDRPAVTAEFVMLLREVYPGMWLYRNEHGNYGIKEGTGYSTCGSLEGALAYAQRVWQRATDREPTGGGIDFECETCRKVFVIPFDEYHGQFDHPPNEPICDKCAADRESENG